jgi:hypothetical protein
MKAKPTLLEKLHQQSSMYASYLPDTVRIPALDGSRPDDVVRPLPDATIDDIAFAIQGLEAESRANHCRLAALRDLYEKARQRGALGVTTVADAFTDIMSPEARP